jgi:hypothetical protein
MKKSEYYMIIAMMAIPMGIILAVSFDKLRVEGIIMTAFGMLVWLFGINFLNKENKQERLEKAAFYTLLKQIYEELKNLRGDSNNGDNKPNTYPPL